MKNLEVILTLRNNIENYTNQGGLFTILENISDDVFITSVSFEDRCLALEKYISSNYSVKLAIIVFNGELVNDSDNNSEHLYVDECRTLVQKNLEKIEEHLGKCSMKIINEESSSLDTVKQINIIKKICEQIQDSSDNETINITIDITSFNRDQLITLLYYMRSTMPNSNIRIIYISPIKHGEWLTKGFRDIRNVIGFPGIHRSSLPTALVVLSGFEPDRVLMLIDEHEPSKVLLGFGDPPIKEMFLDLNVSKQKFVLDKQSVENFLFPADQILGCMANLIKVFEELHDYYNIILAPMSTKLSVIASFLATENSPDIQITYCVPSEYNYKLYSSGIEDVFVEMLPSK